ncbi:MAG: hypothetical protein ABIH36_04045 [bacterium]
MAINIGKPDPIDCDKIGINCSKNPSSLEIANIFFKFIAPLLTIAAIIFVAALVYGGAMYIMSTGDESKAQKAKLIVIYAVIGLVIIGLAGIAVNVFLNIP